MKGYITVGIPASGKTTWTKEQDVVDINRDWIRFNVVCPGSDWSNYKFNRKQEDEVTEIQHHMLSEAAFNGKDVVISDTNLNQKTRNKWVETLESFDYEVEILEFPITLEEAYKRDRLRPNGVGEAVIYSMYQKWLEYKGRKTYTPDESLPKAVVFDVDGTLAKMVNRGPFDWNKVDQDEPKQFVVEMAQQYSKLGYVIIVLSGRDGVCADKTYKWLGDNGVPFEHLYMRAMNDRRKDAEIKEELFWNHIADNYNVVACVDDRPQMIRLWYELKIPNVISVANPYIEF